MAKFEMEVLENYYKSVLVRVPTMAKLHNRIHFKKMLDGIVLPDIPNDHEIYIQDLNMIGCGVISVTWNIDKLLSYQPEASDFEKHTVRELLTLLDFDSPQTISVLKEIDMGMKSLNKKDYIILAMLPGFPEFRIIDGNHRVLEKINEPDYCFTCFMLADERVLDFLEPNSRKFIESVYYVSDISKKSK